MSSTAAPMCSVCQRRPCYYDAATQHFHPYCGRTCARNAAAAAPPPPPPPPPPPAGGPPAYPSYAQAQAAPAAAAHAHARARTPPNIRRPAIETLAPGDSKYEEVKRQFEMKWKGTPKPTIEAISRVYAASSVQDAYDKYNAQISQIVPRGYKMAGPGNTQRRFHGTRQECTLGYKGNTSLCSNSSCAVCGIIRTGFRAGSWGLYGPGIYFTSTPSKSHNYNSASSNGLGAGRRSMFVTLVTLGKVHLQPSTDSSIKGPPAGCHAIIAESGASNDDEAIVYISDAALPRYLIVYKA